VTGAQLPKNRFRFGAVAIAAVVVVVVVCLLFVACSGSSGKKAASPSEPAAAPSNNFKQQPLKAGAVDVESIGPLGTISKGVQKAVLAASQKYVGSALLAPLESGSVGVSYANLFDPSVRDAATSTDRGALTDDGVGPASKYKQTAGKVAISGLVDGDGHLIFAATDFTVKTVANVDGGQATLTHDVELTFNPMGLITAYRVKTIRKLPAAPTTSTVAKSGSTP
jgi:hypothetical protein